MATTNPNVQALLERVHEYGEPVLVKILESYEDRVKTLEQESSAYVECKLRMQVLQHMFDREAAARSELSETCDALRFRMMSGGGGADPLLFSPLGERPTGETDRMNSSALNKVALQRCFMELGVSDEEGETMPPAVNILDEKGIPNYDPAVMEALAEENRQLRLALEDSKKKIAGLKQQVEKMHDTVTTQGSEAARLRLELQKLQVVCGKQREEAELDRQEKLSAIASLKQELQRAHDELTQLELRTVAEATEREERHQKETSAFAKSNQSLTFEVERLRHADRRCGELEEALALANKRTKEVASNLGEQLRISEERYRALKTHVERRLYDAAQCFNTLPTMEKVPVFDSVVIENIEGMTSLPDLGENLISEQLDGIDCMLKYVSVLLRPLAESTNAATLMKKEAEQFESLQKRRDEIDKMLLRVDISLLSDEYKQEVEGLIRQERKLAAQTNNISRLVSLQEQVGMSDGKSLAVVDAVDCVLRRDTPPSPIEKQESLGILTAATKDDPASSSTPSFRKSSDRGSAVIIRPARTPNHSPLPNKECEENDAEASSLGEPQKELLGIEVAFESPGETHSFRLDPPRKGSRTPSEGTPTPATHWSGKKDGTPTPTPRGGGALTPLPAAERRPSAKHLVPPPSPLAPQSPKPRGSSAFLVATPDSHAPLQQPPSPTDSEGAPERLPEIPLPKRSKSVMDSALVLAEGIEKARNLDWQHYKDNVVKEREENLKRCNEILRLSQAMYVRSKGIFLPPLDEIVLDPRGSFGAPMPLKRAGGAVKGKLVTVAAARRKSKRASRANPNSPLVLQASPLKAPPPPT